MFRDLKHRIINRLLDEDEIIQKKTPVCDIAPAKTENTETPSEPTQRKQKTRRYNRTYAPIIYGTDPKRGVIKKRRDGYWVYYNHDGKPHQRKGKLNELKHMLDSFITAGSTPEAWQKIFGKPEQNMENAYIYLKNDKYTVVKTINRIQRTWGNYSTIEKARVVRDFLEYHNWDLQYIPAKMCGKTKTGTDEYYLAILPFMMDEDFERWRALRKLGED